MIGDSLGSTDGKVIASDEGIKLGLFDCGVLGTIFGNIGGIELGIDVGTDMVSLDESFDGSNDGNLEGSFLDELLGSDYVVEVGATNC